MRIPLLRTDKIVSNLVCLRSQMSPWAIMQMLTISLMWRQTATTILDGCVPTYHGYQLQQALLHIRKTEISGSFSCRDIRLSHFNTRSLAQNNESPGRGRAKKVDRWKKTFCQAQPSSIQLQLSWLGWDSFNFNFSNHWVSSLNYLLIGSRISLKPAWAELGTAQSQLVWIFFHLF